MGKTIALIDFPVTFADGMTIADKENYLIEPFVTLFRHRPTFQLVVCGRAFENLQGVHRIALTTVWQQDQSDGSVPAVPESDEEIVFDQSGAGDPHDLNRFVAAQAGVYEQALAEIRGGRKLSYWMWFIFPQIVGLGSSSTARRYAIQTRAEAEAYLAHPVLGPRLQACAEAAAAVPGPATAVDVFGTPDDLKLRSSATLFACVSSAGSVFDRVLDRYFRGERDAATIRLLDARSDPA